MMKNNRLVYLLIFALLIFVVCLCVFIYSNNTGHKESLITPTATTTVATSSDSVASTTVLVPFDLSDLNGTWIGTASGPFNNYELTISNKTDKSFSFDLTSQNGAATGEVTGSATLKDNKSGAKFTATDKTLPCTIEFSFGTSTIKISDIDNTCAENYAGANASFDDEYSKTFKVPAASVSGAFKSKTNFEAFKKLVGTSIKLFNDTSQIATDDVSIDPFNAHVTTYGVQGLYTISESIIMEGQKGMIYAAVIDPNKDTVYYFTNDPAYKSTLPDTIENWRSRFADKKIIYQSK